MSGPQQGEPYYGFPGPAISIGDMLAAPGTNAWKGVIVVDPDGTLSPNIINTGDPINLEVRIKCCDANPSGFQLSDDLSVNFHATNLLTGNLVGTFPATTGPEEIPEADWPEGWVDRPHDAPDFVDWYSFRANGLNLPNGTYRIITHGHEPNTGLMFFHDGTVIHVGP